MLTESLDGKLESGVIKAENENDPGARVVVLIDDSGCRGGRSSLRGCL